MMLDGFVRTRLLLDMLGTKTNANDTITLTLEYEDVDVLRQALEATNVLRIIVKKEALFAQLPNENQIKALREIVTDAITNK